LEPRTEKDWFICALQNNAKLVLTDSGGVQEETCVLHVPRVTLRCNTERLKTLELGANTLAGRDPDEIVKAFLMLAKNHYWKNPFGDGKVAERILREEFA
jgi:UDP-N-acetylglucosamine 2-epimerase (non-hydrolysing)